MTYTRRNSSSIRALLGFVSLGALVACQGSNTDPKTITKGDLNPPFQLVSITKGDKLVLQWRISNTEKDVAGYNVYVAKKKLADVQQTLTAADVREINLGSQQLPRCKSTTGAFALFGFKADSKFAQKDCDDVGVEAPEETSTAASSGATGGSSRAGAAADEETPAEVSKFVKCVDDSGTDVGRPGLLSVDISKAKGAGGTPVPSDLAKRVGATIKCTVAAGTALSDDTQGFETGAHYTAFVMSVQGEKANKVSFTSNFVEDIPTTYSEVKGITLNDDSGAAFAVKLQGTAPTGVVAKVADNVACGASQADSPTGCRLNRAIPTTLTAAAAGEPRIFVVADNQTDTERVLIAGENGKIYLAKRDSRQSEGGESGAYTPGDRAMKFDGSQYYTNQMLAAFPGDLFDVAYKPGAGQSYHYGKVYFDKLASSATSANLGEASKTMDLIFAMQKAADEVFYIADPTRRAGLVR